MWIYKSKFWLFPSGFTEDTWMLPGWVWWMLPLGSGGTKGYLQVSSISLRTFYLHLWFLPKRHVDGAGRPNSIDISGLLSQVTSRGNAAVDRMRNWGKRKRVEMEDVNPKSQVHMHEVMEKTLQGRNECQNGFGLMSQIDVWALVLPSFWVIPFSLRHAVISLILK